MVVLDVAVSASGCSIGAGKAAGASKGCPSLAAAPAAADLSFFHSQKSHCVTLSTKDGVGSFRTYAARGQVFRVWSRQNRWERPLSFDGSISSTPGIGGHNDSCCFGSFFRPEFDDFLYAPVGADKGEMPLSVLSALSRLDVDPWREAAELSELPRGVAAQRLASLIARLPGGRWPLADARSIADGLIQLLPHRDISVPSVMKTGGLHGMNVSTIVLICASLVIAGLIIAASYERSTRNYDADAPAYSNASPPQTSVPSSR